jgi:hypothetical protein
MGTLVWFVGFMGAVSILSPRAHTFLDGCSALAVSAVWPFWVVTYIVTQTLKP